MNTPTESHSAPHPLLKRKRRHPVLKRLFPHLYLRIKGNHYAKGMYDKSRLLCYFLMGTVDFYLRQSPYRLAYLVEVQRLTPNNDHVSIPTIECSRFPRDITGVDVHRCWSSLTWMSLKTSSALFRAFHTSWHEKGRLAHCNAGGPENSALPKQFRFYRLLHQYLAKAHDMQNTEAASLPNHDLRQPYLIHIPVWGEQACHTLLHYMLPSLLATGNLPALSDTHRIELLLHCNESLLPVLQRHPLLTKLAGFCNILIRPFPDGILEAQRDVPFWLHDNAKYCLYGGLQQVATSRAALVQSSVSFFNADFVFTKDAIRKCFDHLDSGKLAVLATAFRSRIDTMSADLQAHKSDWALELSPADAINLGCQHIHAAALRRIVSNNTKDFQFTAQLLFRDDSGIVVRACHYHPLLVSGRLLTTSAEPTFETVDSALLSRLLRGHTNLDQSVYVVENAQELSFLELSDESVEVSVAATPRACLETAELRRVLRQKLPQFFSDPFCRFLFQKRALFPLTGSGSATPSGDLVFLQGMDDLLAAA